MTRISEGLAIGQTPVVRLENAHLVVDVAPRVGGRIVSLVDKASHYSFLWHNQRLTLEKLEPGTPYDPNFYGGIDELIPNDMVEPMDDLALHDHGELWTTALGHRMEGETLILEGGLPLCGLRYERHMRLRPASPHLDLDYRITNEAEVPRDFLWKLHAAMNVQPGDRIACPARTARPVDPEWSRWATMEPFPWPTVEGQRADLIPAPDGTTDFLYLYELEEGLMAWLGGGGQFAFSYTFDPAVFPYALYFASFGGLDGHYTAVLEPCTSMPLSLVQARELGQCAHLEPGETLETRVTIYAGPQERS